MGWRSKSPRSQGVCIAAADFSRIRNAALGRFTVDRLISVLNRLGSRVEVKVRMHRADAAVLESGWGA